MNTPIWTVSTLGLRHEHVGPRTWGFYHSLEEALDGLHRFCDDECGYYTHAIVESFKPGIYAEVTSERWFEWQLDMYGWKPCEKPESESHVINYGMG